MEKNSDFVEVYYEGLDNVSYIRDGINCKELYKQSPLKILWILKEAHAQDKSQSWDHRIFQTEQLFQHSKWYSTFGQIIRVSRAILENNYDYHFDSLKELSKDSMLNIMKRIAVINVKKKAGDSKSEHEDIKKEYLKHRTILLKQIEDINPDVIINCSRIYELYTDLGEGESFGFDVNYYKEVNSRLIIHAHHPSKIGYKSETEIIKILKGSFDNKQSPLKV